MLQGLHVDFPSGLVDRFGDMKQRAVLVILLCPLRCDLQTRIALGLYAAPPIGPAPFADIIHSPISFKVEDNFPEGLKIADQFTGPASSGPAAVPGRLPAPRALACTARCSSTRPTSRGNMIAASTLCNGHIGRA